MDIKFCFPAGMLWLDNTQETTLAQKIIQALEYYKGKYEIKPNLVYVSEKEFDPETKVDGIEIRSAVSIPKNNYLLVNSKE